MISLVNGIDRSLEKVGQCESHHDIFFCSADDKLCRQISIRDNRQPDERHISSPLRSIQIVRVAIQ